MRENTFWSKNVQSTLTLYTSRDLRFSDRKKTLVLDTLHLRPGMNVLDSGCGPGALTLKLAKWLSPSTAVTGVDQDSKFISFARATAKKQNIGNAIFRTGDALHLPFADNTFDTCISHTLIEHVPNRQFLVEQKRVCKNGGRISVLLVRPDKSINSGNGTASESISEEHKLRAHIDRMAARLKNKQEVGKYWPGDTDIPKLFQELACTDIQVDALALPMVLDDARIPLRDKILLIRQQHATELEALKNSVSMPGMNVNQTVKNKLKRLIAGKYQVRTAMAFENKSLWDFTVSLVMVYSAEVAK